MYVCMFQLSTVHMKGPASYIHVCTTCNAQHYGNVGGPTDDCIQWVGPTPMQCAVREGGHEVHMEAHGDRVGAVQCDSIGVCTENS